MRFLLVGISIAAGLWGQVQLPSDAGSLQNGKTLYQFHCAFCHGKGDDGMAANLVSPNLVHAPTDSSLVALIRTGIPGAGMPPALGMNEREILQLASYVRSLGRSAPTSVPGDVANGKALYNGKGGCANCHMVQGEGGRMGPDLTLIGAMRSPMNLRTSIVDPNAALVGGWVMVSVTPKTGATVRGIRLNEDNFYIHLRDRAGKIHSIAKDTVTRIDRDLTKSSMPSYQKVFNEKELEDLVAYLFSLRGAH